MENKNSNNVDKAMFAYFTNIKDIGKKIESVLKEKSTDVCIVRLSDKLLDDLQNKMFKTKNENDDCTAKNISDLVDNEDNRNKAFCKASQLWSILTSDASPIDSEKIIFTKSEVVKRTTLSNKTLGELLNLLKVFGFIDYDKGNYQFHFIFNEDNQKDMIHKEILKDIEIMKNDVIRYMSLFNKKERSEIFKSIQDKIQEVIIF